MILVIYGVLCVALWNAFFYTLAAEKYDPVNQPTEFAWVGVGYACVCFLFFFIFIAPIFGIDVALMLTVLVELLGSSGTTTA